MSISLRCSDTLDVDHIRELIEIRGFSYLEVSRRCLMERPERKGCSARSIRRFCARNNIHCRSRIDDSSLDRIISTCVSKVGRSYGRKTMCGLLRSEGWQIGENRIGKSLNRVNPMYLQHRRSEVYRNINPLPYTAHYFGHKLHVDQNEKIVMFGVVHVLAVDGYSKKIVSLVTMPRKNCVVIYDHMFLEVVRSFGLWQQLRVDHGTEWALALFMQNRLSSLRNDPTTSPYLQTPSTQNHTVERLWVEVNNRVNYPLKRILIDMVEREYINMNHEHHKYCVSWITINVANVGLKLLVQSWNNHPLPRTSQATRGTPNARMLDNNRVVSVDQRLLLNPVEAVNMYREMGGSVTEENDFGVDPLKDNPHKLYLRQQAFLKKFEFSSIFHSVVNENEAIFVDALLFYIDLTHRLSCS